MKKWRATQQPIIKREVFRALVENVSYKKKTRILGLPGSYLDRKVFGRKGLGGTVAKVFKENPNHIGCHTFGIAEPAFKGTQKLEVKFLKLCAENLLEARPGNWEGYVSTGGTESNIQALWIFREYFKKSRSAPHEKIVVLCSEDTHYSIWKAAGMLCLDIEKLKVDPSTRQILSSQLEDKLKKLRRAGKRFCIFVANMGTTMFGSVDQLGQIPKLLRKYKFKFRIHVDAAFGGFIYPLTCDQNKLSFQNNQIHSFTMDAHKMLQAPYSTGIFLTRKRNMKYAHTQALYVPGGDYTVCGSRSGAVAVAAWMILAYYGSKGGRTFLSTILENTSYLCEELKKLGIEFFRNENMNIVAIPKRALREPERLVKQFILHETSTWVSIAIMAHVTRKTLASFIAAVRADSET